MFRLQRTRKLSNAPVPNGEGSGGRGSCELDWQVGDLAVICDNETRCSLFYSSIGIFTYREAKMFMQTASSTRYATDDYEDLPLIFCSNAGDVPLFRFAAKNVSGSYFHLFSDLQLKMSTSAPGQVIVLIRHRSSHHIEEGC